MVLLDPPEDDGSNTQKRVIIKSPYKTNNHQTKKNEGYLKVAIQMKKIQPMSHGDQKIIQLSDYITYKR